MQSINCPNCGGYGYFEVWYSDAGHAPEVQECFFCKGSGKANQCRECGIPAHDGVDTNLLGWLCRPCLDRLAPGISAD